MSRPHYTDDVNFRKKNWRPKKKFIFLPRHGVKCAEKGSPLCTVSTASSNSTLFHPII